MTLQSIMTGQLGLQTTTAPIQRRTQNASETFDIGNLLVKEGLQEPSQNMLEAREKLYKLVASNGIDYANAMNNVKEIEKKYNKECQSTYKQKQPSNMMVYFSPVSQFDPTKIPNQKDKERYYASIRAMQEIEQNHSALFAETGLKSTKLPNEFDKVIGNNFDIFG